MADITAGSELPKIKGAGLFMPAAVVAVVVLLIVPLPTGLLDALMAFNLILSLLILLNVLYTQKATDFSIFPMVLLVVTVFSLALNVSSTRLILTQGARFDGRMIRAISQFVAGVGGTGGLVVSFILFIIITIAQAIVIAKRARHISEVATRFSLDAMGPKLKTIEAEYNAGAITEEEADQKRREIQMESDFSGAMDGASKFISGNVVVGILITAINIIGGLVVGVAIHGESSGEALVNYISLAIGDGLLFLVPSLLVSTAAGFVVTRAAETGTPSAPSTGGQDG
ncbi:MAG: flagellar biosynthesis protein FlhA [Spirochaetaceae bacterium]|jgi:flagellar biosynthesis protein FlhA|nr:flagellar biosynthesis protein FlhA [Spirochaetaceae bacterium]